MIGSAPVLSVSEFVAVFNQSVSMSFPEVVIVGELSNFRISKNAWVYFDLKDELASVKFFGSVRVLPGPIEDGMLVEVVGRPYLHPQFGFSVQVQVLSVTGEGSLTKAFTLLMKKLEKEGLFDESRKRALPYAPNKIAVVSSKESAGYGDFVKIAKKRWPMLNHKLFDVKVQGTSAPEEIVTAITKANQSEFDALVIIRGGGSRDDLVAFDHEQVVRAVASSRWPTLVAIGHERDVVLAELAADQRASTPSNAAEILSPDIVEEKRNLIHMNQQIRSILSSYTESIKNDIKHFRTSIDRELISTRDKEYSNILQFKRLLAAFDPKLPLQKGYAIVRSSDTIIKSAHEAKKHQLFSLEFADDTINVKREGNN